MRLTGVAIQKYRSIKRTPRLNLGDLTVLVGPNNEGKSNILRALTLSMQLLRRYGVQNATRAPSARAGASSTSRIGPPRMRTFRSEYDWTEDFPKDLQARTPEGNTIIDLWFELDAAEQADFLDWVGSRLKTELPIRLTISGRSVEFAVRKQGPGGATLTRKASRVAQFVGSQLRVEHVQSIRTASRARDVVQDMLLFELEQGDPEVEAATGQLVEALRPTMDRLSSELQQTLKDFLPDVANVEVELSSNGVITGLAKSIRIVVDDGVATDLSHKGDGVQSLAALALVRKAAESSRRSGLILGIEEPEAHLHPRAVHSLRTVLGEIAAKQQVVITTHSPLLVNRYDLAGNIVVRSNRAGPARGLGDLRDALGVRVGDNLSNAGLVLVVEGGCDKSALRALFAELSEPLTRALAAGTMAIDSMGSAANLTARLDQLRSQLCLYHVLVDDDEAGRTAAGKARAAGLLRPNEENLVTVPGLSQAEFEDTIDPALYSAAVLKEFGVDLAEKQFRSGRKKWADRVESAFMRQGKNWDSQVKVAVKALVAARVASEPAKALHHARSASIVSLVRELERRVSEVEGAA